MLLGTQESSQITPVSNVSEAFQILHMNKEAYSLKPAFNFMKAAVGLLLLVLLGAPFTILRKTKQEFDVNEFPYSLLYLLSSLLPAFGISIIFPVSYFALNKPYRNSMFKIIKKMC